MVGMYYACQAGENLVEAAVITGTVITVGALGLTCLACCARRKDETPLVRNVRRSCIACGCGAAALGLAIGATGFAIVATVIVDAAKMFYGKY